MKLPADAPGFARIALNNSLVWVCVFCACLFCPLLPMTYAQNPPNSHVVIPNPTPRPTDLEQVYSKDPSAKKDQGAVSTQNQVRAREVWLEANQILFIAQQLRLQLVPGKTVDPMAANAQKVEQIEKLAKSMQANMKVQ